MNPIDLLGRGVGAATGAARVATSVPRLVLNLLRDRDHDGNGSDPFAAAADIERDDDERVAAPAERVTRPRGSATATPTAPAPAPVRRGERRFNDVREQAPRHMQHMVVAGCLEKHDRFFQRLTRPGMFTALHINKG